MTLKRFCVVLLLDRPMQKLISILKWLNYFSVLQNIQMTEVFSFKSQVCMNETLTLEITNVLKELVVLVLNLNVHFKT